MDSLAELLVERELLTVEQASAIAQQNGHSQRSIADKVAESGLVGADELLTALAAYYGLSIVSLRNHHLDPAVLRIVPAAIVQRHKCLPIERKGNRLIVGVFRAPSLQMLDEVRFATLCQVEPVLVPEHELLEAIEHHYDVTVEKMLQGMAGDSEGETGGEDYFIHDLQQKASEPTLINLVNLIIAEAIAEGASDIHVEPFERELKIKYRVDGILQEVAPPPKNLQPAIVSRIKIMAGMDIAKRHIPQDGYIRINLNNNQVDIRVATVPTIFGEGVVMRLLNKASILMTLEELGLRDETYERFVPLLTRSYGMLLVCGPTGSGKTTTLYAVLNKIFTPQKKIITIEDPVEYQLNGVNQIPVRPQRGVTFATGLRSVLRLDPDVLLVGEIRDLETAEIAVRSALTGHLIFSTLHTNDAASAITRLLDMEMEPYLIASSLQGVLAQRLVRVLCPVCRESFEPSDALLDEFEKTRDDAHGRTFYRAVGCDDCKGRGYNGRIGIFELLTVTDELQQMIVQRDASPAIKAAAQKAMTTMREDGWTKICDGTTTFEEVVRQTQREQGKEIMIEALDE